MDWAILVSDLLFVVMGYCLGRIHGIRKSEKQKESSIPKGKYVGGVAYQLQRIKGTQKIIVDMQIAYLMNENDDRSFIIFGGDEKARKFTQDYMKEYTDALAWKSGGPFPKNFEPVGDTLGEMLNRLIDKKFTGE